MNETINKNLDIAKKIKKLGITNLIIHIVTIIAFLTWIITSFVMISNLQSNNSNMNTISETQIGLVIFIIFIGITYFLCNIIIGIIVIIRIANTNWENENLNQAKLIFWILSIVFIMMILVNPILWIVWAKKVKNSYSSQEEKISLIK